MVTSVAEEVLLLDQLLTLVREVELPPLAIGEVMQELTREMVDQIPAQRLAEELLLSLRQELELAPLLLDQAIAEEIAYTTVSLLQEVGLAREAHHRAEVLLEQLLAVAVAEIIVAISLRDHQEALRVV